jgi:hypothetical protein
MDKRDLKMDAAIFSGPHHSDDLPTAVRQRLLYGVMKGVMPSATNSRVRSKELEVISSVHNGLG